MFLISRTDADFTPGITLGQVSESVHLMKKTGSRKEAEKQHFTASKHHMCACAYTMYRELSWYVKIVHRRSKVCLSLWHSTIVSRRSKLVDTASTHHTHLRRSNEKKGTNNPRFHMLPACQISDTPPPPLTVIFQKNSYPLSFFFKDVQITYPQRRPLVICPILNRK